MEGELVVCFNLDGKVEDLYPTLTALESPLKHVANLPGNSSYLLEHRRLNLANTITYGPSDYGVNNECQLHQRARTVLGFCEQSELNHEWDYDNPDDLEALREIRAYLHRNRIGEFVFADWEMGNFLAGGFNPKTGGKIPNNNESILPL